MSKEAIKTVVPRLRFPEFRKQVEWRVRQLNELLIENKQRNRDLKYGPNDVLSVSGEFGCINQIELLGRSYAGVSVKDYHVVNTGDVVYTKSPLKRNPFGIIKENKGKAGIVSTLYAVYSPTDICHASYLDHYFADDHKLNSFLQPIVRKGPKNTLMVNNAAVLTGDVVAPSVAEQQKVTNCLSSLDDLITAQTDHVTALKQYKKGLLQQLFPEEGETVPSLRFSEFNKFGDWGSVHLGEIADLTMGYAFKSSDFVENGVQLIRIGNLYQNELCLDRNPVYLPESFLNEFKKFIIEQNDILISMTGTAGKKDYGYAVIVPPDSRPLLLNQRVTRVRSKQEVSQEFLLYAMRHPSFTSPIYSDPGGTKQANISIGGLSKIKVALPQIYEQQQIANCLSSLDALITAQSEVVEFLKSHKQGLLQQLFPSLTEGTDE